MNNEQKPPTPQTFADYWIKNSSYLTIIQEKKGNAALAMDVWADASRTTLFNINNINESRNLKIQLDALITANKKLHTKILGHESTITELAVINKSLEQIINKHSPHQPQL